MDREQIKKIIDGPEAYSETRAETVYAWFRDCYSRTMRWVMVCVFLQYLILAAPAAYCAFAFFQTDQMGAKILYATIFLFCNLWMGFVSVFGWVMMQRPSIRREIKRLELRIAELSEAVGGR